MVSCDTLIPCDRFRRYILVMGFRNKQQRHKGDLTQARRDLYPNNEDLEIVDNEPESGYDVLDIDMESFISMIH